MAAQRVGEMLERGDYESVAVWLRIRRVIAEMTAVPEGRPN